MSNSKTIDILMATYNGQAYIGEQIESLLSQTYSDWRLLIRDDGSTDQTRSIISDLMKHHPEKIHLIDDQAGHVGAAQNFIRLLDRAESPYLMFCDQDDIWLPDKIERSLQAMQNVEMQCPGQPVLIHTDLKVIDSQGNTIADSFWKYKQMNANPPDCLAVLLHRNFVTGCTAMINRKAKEVSLPMPPECRIHDWWIALNVARHGRIHALNVPTVLYRQHGGNVIGAARSRIRFFEWPKRFFKLIGQSKKNYRCVRQVLPDVSFLPWFVKEISVQCRGRFRRS